MVASSLSRLMLDSSSSLWASRSLSNSCSNWREGITEKYGIVEHFMSRHLLASICRHVDSTPPALSLVLYSPGVESPLAEHSHAVASSHYCDKRPHRTNGRMQLPDGMDHHVVGQPHSVDWPDYHATGHWHCDNVTSHGCF